MRKRISIRSQKDITLEEGFKMFITDRKLFGVSEVCIKNYMKNFQFFTEYIVKDTLCSDITEDTYKGYIEHMSIHKPHLSPISVNTYLSHMRAILYFLMNKGYVENFQCDLIKAEKPLKKTYRAEELLLMFEEPNKSECSFTDYRNWALVCYFIATGNRMNTVVNLKIGDLDFVNNEIMLTTVKNKRQDIVPMSTALKKVLKKYLEVRGSDNPEDYLFCTVYGEKLSSSGLDTALERYLKKRGIPQTGIHKMRHTFATEYLRNGGRPEKLQILLGHSTLAMAMEYVHLVKSDVKIDYDYFNPLDNIMPTDRKGAFIKVKRK